VTTTPMNAGPAIRALLNRPDYEKVMVLLPIGFPASGCEVPNIVKKPLDVCHYLLIAQCFVFLVC
jgi:iodotyrosine deiodinase